MEEVIDIDHIPSGGSSDFAERPRSLDEAEREVILAALLRNGGQRRRTAQELHISERTLYRKIKEYNLDV